MARRKDVFDEDELELQILTRRPTSFLMLGKPGVGKSTLSAKLAAVWKCQLVDGKGTIEEAMRHSTTLGYEAKNKLSRGEELDETLVADIMLEKLSSPEVKNYGYVLDGLPSAPSKWIGMRDQIDMIKNLDAPPDIIVNLKIPDSDLERRRIGQKVDPATNEVFIKSIYDPEQPLRSDDLKQDISEEGNKDVKEDDKSEKQEEGETKVEDDFNDDLGEMFEQEELSPDVVNRLVTRVEDYPHMVKGEISYYKQQMLQPLEEYIVQHSQQYVIELDANLSPKELLRDLLTHLTLLGLPRAPLVHRLVSPEADEEDETEGLDEEQFLQTVSATNALSPRFKWRRSRWGRFCPVELSQGNLIQGKMEYSVGFLDKMYCLSSLEALTAFTCNPREYLLPPNPRVPCRVCVLGPPTSGKTSLSKALADHYKAKYLDVNELITPVLQQSVLLAVKKARESARLEQIAQLTTEWDTSQSLDEKPKERPVFDDHPQVLGAMQEAEDRLTKSPPEPSPEECIKALRESIKIAAARQARADGEDGTRCGGWVVDGFPQNSEQWTAMADSGILPDVVLSLEVSEEDADILLKRFLASTKLVELQKPSSEDISLTVGMEQGEKEKQPLQSAPEIGQWKKLCSNFERQWGVLVPVMKNAPVNFIPLNCGVQSNDLLQNALCKMEAIFDHPVLEVSPLDDESDMDDDSPNEGEDGDDEAAELYATQRKGWGDSSIYCPVALSDNEVLWPGNQEFACRYREKLYCLSSEEAKEKFMNTPKHYLSSGHPLEAPSPRILLLGVKGSGKTLLGQSLAKKHGIFHVEFRNYLQEQILSKLKQPPLVDIEDFEGPDSEQKEEDLGSSGVDNEAGPSLSEREAEIHMYLMKNEPLSDETIDHYITRFWKEEPYKSCGFILEGFPCSGDELRYLCSRGLYPDAAAILEVEEHHVVSRLLPGKMDIWSRKRRRFLQKQAKLREERFQEWKEEVKKKRQEIEAEYEKKRSARVSENTADDENDVGEYIYEEYQEQLAELNSEEFPEEEEEELEEEEEVRERFQSSIVEKFEEQNEAVFGMQDVLSEMQVPFHVVPAGRKVSIVSYILERSLEKYLSSRIGLLNKGLPLDSSTAKSLLDHGYKHLSQFRHHCPVKLFENHCSVLPPTSMKHSVPVAYRQYIYFLSSQKAKKRFVSKPECYLDQRVPSVSVPLRVAILGPPKSGKTTVAERFVKEYGCARLSIGEAVRRVIDAFPNSDLSQQMLSYLKLGQSVPDELCILALDRMLLNIHCSCNGYVLDGWPVTRMQAELLTRYKIIPLSIVELQITDAEMLQRAENDRQNVHRPYVVHDSPGILLVRRKKYDMHLETVKEHYMHKYQNWHTVIGSRNCWFVFEQAKKIVLDSALQMQQYLLRITEGKAASVHKLCITPQEFKNKLGEFGEYCPVRLGKMRELVDCSRQTSLQYAAEYKGFYYQTAGQSELQTFLNTPEKYAGLTACCQLPPLEGLPKRITELEVKSMFPIKYEIQGFCPVSYVDGKKRYESLTPGLPEFSVQYKGKLFCFATEDCLETFMRLPEKYDICDLPIKVPPVKDQLSLTSLPMLGYLEQTVATSILDALHGVGCTKPKFPFISKTKSALLYMALHLKAFNSRCSVFTREKFKQKLAHFKQQCELIHYLGEMMTLGYIEPLERTAQFEERMDAFIALSQSSHALKCF